MRSARELQARSFPLDDHLRDGSLDDPGGALAFLARQRSRDSKADTRTCLDKFLPAQPACTSGPHALGERLVHDVLQQALLARDVERKCIAWRRSRGIHGLDRCGQGWCRRTQLDVYDRRGGVRGDRDSVDAVEHRTDRAHVLLQRAQD